MLELHHVIKDYYVDNKPFRALKDISVAFPDKGFVSVLGPSGCGKTTLLNIIGGLDHYTSGDLVIDGKSTKDFKDSEWDAYRNERVGFVFQSYNLIPHMNVINNVEVSLMLNGVKKVDREKAAYIALSKVGLVDEAKKKPNQLSGGQMQRVAIARALINNPKIVLADEPTGALDSVTSVQVMDLLKEVAADRLVIMVTHNRELADKYSDRIIEMKDGVIMSDTNSAPLTESAVTGKEINKKTAMSFFTALKSSLQNIGTKKTRTILTAVASSFGIIGVALVLAVNNGFSLYVGNVESSIASSVPITVSPTHINYSTNDAEKNKTEYPDDNQIRVYDTSANGYVVHRNVYTKEYFDYLDQLKDEGLIKSWIKNKAGLDFNLLTADGSTGNYMKVSQYSSAGLAGSVLSSYTALPATIFHELYIGEDGLENTYETIYGRFPTNSHELVLVTDKYNRIELSTLKGLGILNSDGTSSNANINFSDLVYDGMGDSTYKEYKAYPNSTYFQTSSEAKQFTYNSSKIKGISIDNDGTTRKLRFVSEKNTTTTSAFVGPNSNATAFKTIYSDDAKYQPADLKIVGVLRPSKDSYIAMMPASIGYLPSLKDELANDVNTTGGALLAQYLKSNWYLSRALTFSGSWNTTTENVLNLSLNDFDDVSGTGNESGTATYNTATDALDITLSGVKKITGTLKRTVGDQGSFYGTFAGDVVKDDTTKWKGTLKINKDNTITYNDDYFNFADGVSDLSSAINTLLSSVSGTDSSATAEISTNAMNTISAAFSYRSSTIGENQYNQSVSNPPVSAGPDGFTPYGYFSKAYATSTDFGELKASAFVNALQAAKDDQDKFLSILDDVFDDPNFYSSTATPDNEYGINMMDLVAYYRSFSLVTSVLIFPKSLTTKDTLKARLDDWNSTKSEADQMVYDDIMSTFTSSLSIMLNVLSTVLIVFASISLVVSSVMTGIITYVSVVERTKEIGILRACGARKKDVGRLFEAECVIIGFGAGLLGILVTWLLCLPIGQIIDHIYPGNNLIHIAQLNPWHALILLVLAVLLAFVSGLIPARMAAKKDPVIALRSE
jgi:putative ABC transport system permease protein